MTWFEESMPEKEPETATSAESNKLSPPYVQWAEIAPKRRAFMLRLKSETSAVYRAIESAVDLMGDDVSRADYQSYLLARLGYCEPADAALSRQNPWAMTLPDFSTRLKCHLIREEVA